MKKSQHKCKKTHCIAFLLFLTLLIFLLIYKQSWNFEITESQIHVADMNHAEALLESNQTTGVQRTILLASPAETLTLNGKAGFSNYQENFATILEISAKHPEHFVPFCTISPQSQDMMAELEDCIKKGGRGIKLYNGHTHFHDLFGMALDDEKMTPIYSFAEKKHLPVVFHVNVTNYEDELRKVLSAHPNMVVSVPHFMVSSIDLERVTRLLDDYPNLYTDISFGAPTFMAAGLRRISNDVEKYSVFFENYADRILFGTDMILGEAGVSDSKSMAKITKCYKDLLMSRNFVCEPVNNFYLENFDKQRVKSDSCGIKSSDYCLAQKEKAEHYHDWFLETKRLNGLNLGRSVLKKVFEENAERFLSGRWQAVSY